MKSIINESRVKILELEKENSLILEQNSYTYNDWCNEVRKINIFESNLDEFKSQYYEKLQDLEKNINDLKNIVAKCVNVNESFSDVDNLISQMNDGKLFNDVSEYENKLKGYIKEGKDICDEILALDRVCGQAISAISDVRTRYKKLQADCSAKKEKLDAMWTMQNIAWSNQPESVHKQFQYMENWWNSHPVNI